MYIQTCLYTYVYMYVGCPKHKESEIKIFCIQLHLLAVYNYSNLIMLYEGSWFMYQIIVHYDGFI